MGFEILVVEDEPMTRRMMRRVLERRGYVVREAADGRSALDAVEESMPDAMLLDLRMPGELSGVEVAQKLKGDAATRTLPIIVVSASTNTDARNVVAEAGADAFVEKPVDFDELYSVLEGVLSGS